MDFETSPATLTDVDGILALMAANQPSQGGRLSASLPRERLLAMLDDLPFVVARHQNEVIGFLLTCSRQMNADVPVIRAMLAAYPGKPDAYVYGPVCVAGHMRGQGVAAAMFACLKATLPKRQGILFVRQDNPVSLKAHRRMAMREVASFDFNGVTHTVFAYDA